MKPPDYRFVPVTRDDYPMLRGWLAQPHIGGWWGDPDREIALIEEDIDSGPTDMRIVQLGDAPFAFVQDYPAHHWPMPHYAGLPDGTRAIDTFIGDPAFLGRGHAARYLRARAAMLLAQGAPLVVVDPDPANHRAIASYARAGFHGETIAPCEDGTPVRVMTFSPGRAPPRPVQVHDENRGLRGADRPQASAKRP
ncbi:GNAT family N-acetyltransferase [Meridianimarinicoccus roseus]|uniref:GNAT family N-acetyltransferase n=1 Tax=Meridianimarinicoccus roseus TaxID=2072018 RepID=A0A2V2LIS9_9RHOB|nr:GNAT family N-acetyltransferase [Meridianimarinicoccus roseus]PWR01753.1 GNAT family N-acetyltransferase [Meridianimarinicoccus roseus]